MTKKLRLLLVDDHIILLEGLKALLSAEFDLVGTAVEGRTVLQLVDTLHPDVILMDISMPNLNGIETTRLVAETHPTIKVIILTMHSDAVFLKAAFEAGASGYLLKHSAPTELLTAINIVAGGRLYVSPLLRKTVETAIPGFWKRPKKITSELSPREREVLQLLAEGKARKEIAGILNISVKTVEFHKHRINEKLGVNTTAELTAYAIRHGIVEG